ncbi:MAG: inosine/xanthosine triphosphatase [Aggregatilineales bacterium]
MGTYFLAKGVTGVRIAVGSLNPVKQRAAETVLSPLYPGVTFDAIAAESGVNEQPWGDVETRTGAINRARAAQMALAADLGIGFEGGVVDTEIGLMTCNWTAIVACDGRIGIGGGGGELLPETVARALRAGGELGPAMDALTGLSNVKQAEGAVGILTGGLVNRQTVYELSLRLALAPFRSPQWYGDEFVSFFTRRGG